MKRTVAAAGVLIALAACSQEGPGGNPAPASMDVMPAAQVTGEPVDCLPVTRLGNSRIRDDRTIDFISPAGGQTWRVTLPNRCSGLKSANTFTYETSLTQLCRQDIIYPLQQFGSSWQRMGGCGMGPFVPVKLAK